MNKSTIIALLCTTAITAAAQKNVATSPDFSTGYTHRLTTWGNIHCDDGVLFMTYDISITSDYNRAETLVKYPQSKEQTTYTIPDGVYVIAKGAFQGNKYLETIRIPSSVSYIGEDAFADCANLKNFEIYSSSSVHDISKDPDTDETREVGRYNINGIKVDENENGVQIILYGNGKAEKVVK